MPASKSSPIRFKETSLPKSIDAAAFEMPYPESSAKDHENVGGVHEPRESP